MTDRIRRDPFAEREARRSRPAAGDSVPDREVQGSGRVRKDPFAERDARRARPATTAPIPAAPASDSGRTRRDPHAERAARRSRQPEAAEAPSPATAEAAGRARRDPHAERQARRGGASAPTQTVRAPSAAPPPKTEPSAPRLPLKKIDAPAYVIFAVPDFEDGRLSSHDKDAIGAARLLADSGGGAVVVLAFGPAEAMRDDPGEAGADRLLRFLGALYAGYAPEARAAAVLAAAQALSPRHIVLPDTLEGGGDVGRRLAARLGDRAAGNVQRIAADRITRRGKGGRSDFTQVPPRVLLIAPESADPVTDHRHEARPIDAPVVSPAPRLEDRGLVATDPSKVPLAEADFIVSGGNGVRDWDGFHRVAAALGASEGGSRPVCDAGHMPRNRQVGASGTLVEPRCYVALGIAGAPQHLQGIAKCERVVAVNADPHCDMVKRADLAVIGDVQAIMPALEKAAQERRGA